MRLRPPSRAEPSRTTLVNSGTLTIATISAPPVRRVGQEGGAERGSCGRARGRRWGAEAPRLPPDEQPRRRPPRRAKSASVTAAARGAIGSSVRAIVRQTRLAPSSAAPGRSRSRVAAPALVARQAPDRERERQAHRQVDPEDAAPADQLGDAAAPERADQPAGLRRRRHGAEAEARAAGATLRRDDGHRDRHDGAAADRLHARGRSRASSGRCDSATQAEPAQNSSRATAKTRPWPKVSATRPMSGIATT